MRSVQKSKAMKRGLAYAVCGVAALLLAMSAPSAEPTAIPMPAEVQDQDTASVAETPSELIYRRETFVYPTDNRRNPFVTLVEDEGPQFEGLDLVGVIFGGSQGSVAALVDRATDRRFRVRRGESVGNARVVEIRPDAVVFSVTQFGVTRSETLTVRKEEGED